MATHRPMNPATLNAGLIVLAMSSAVAGGDPPVQVIVDMDPAAAGHQSSVTVAPCAEVVEVNVFLIDPLGTRAVWSIGYLGGIDRGVAFGHAAGRGNLGNVAGVSGKAGQPANTGNQGFIIPSFALIHTLAGDEVQYMEHGAANPATLSSQPAGPLFSVTIALDGAAAGDVFDFHLVDAVTLSFGGGAFSTQAALNSLDTGGDAVPDGTVTIHGVDIDIPVPVPPASYLVDYIDGPTKGGPATIIVAPLIGDLDADCSVDGADLGVMLLAWGGCPRGVSCPADLSGDGLVDGEDLGVLLLNWTG